ncbi:lipase family protein [Nocardia sp. NPDC046473]|uniref:lipase family protein n=1 Tax=Nocardia sp. NPDC046473 TaxID=3155733 RepID=UPI00340076BB
MNRSRSVVLGVVAAIALSILGSPAALAGPESNPEPPAFWPLPPEFDDFYNPSPAAVAAAEPGQILRARRANLANFSILPLNVDAWQLLYRTNDAHGNAISGVTTVLKPRGPAPAGGRKLLSYQVAENSLAHYCAPSYAWQAGSLPPNLTLVTQLELLLAMTGVQQGWTVSVPDHEGPNSAYAAGPLAGHTTLDGIRAVENFEPAELSGKDTPVGMWGYSGGAIATSWAAELQPSYAPELRIKGVASGGIPSDTRELAKVNNGTLFAGLVFAAIIGVSREYPDLAQALASHVNPLGQAIIAIKKPLCTNLTSVVVPGMNYLGLFDHDPFQDPVLNKVFDDTSLGKAVPTAPMFLYESVNDQITAPWRVDSLVDTYCRDPHASVNYHRDLVSEHLSLTVTGAASALLWLRDRLDGIPAPGGCSTETQNTMLTDLGAMDALIGALGGDFAALLGNAIGSQTG